MARSRFAFGFSLLVFVCLQIGCLNHRSACSLIAKTAIAVRVVDPLGSAIEDAEVTLVGKHASYSLTRLVDTGYYTGGWGGAYQLKISAPGYEPHTELIAIDMDDKPCPQPVGVSKDVVLQMATGALDE
jgi:hypothetical protein